jgi:hypothetical protein
VRGPDDYIQWQSARAGQAAHLIVLLHDRCPIEHLRSLAEALRTLRHRPGSRFSLLVAGSAAATQLANATLAGSFFSDLTPYHVPNFTPAEVKALLMSVGEAVDDRLALEVHAATGGYPGFIEELVTDDEPLDEAATIPRLRRSGQVRGILRSRLSQDDEEHTLAPEQHAAEVLRRLLAEGESQERLEAIDGLLEYGETRLYYDGLLRIKENGKLMFRCEAVRQVAEDVLRLRGARR